jgi:hypothetical protein
MIGVILFKQSAVIFAANRLRILDEMERRNTMTMQELLSEWLEGYQRENIKIRTYDRYEGLIALHLLPKLGEKKSKKLEGEKFRIF